MNVSRDLYKWIATLVVLIVVAVVLQGQLSFVITATLFAIFAMSWSFFTSFSGYLNLGHVIFIGLAGYTSAALNYHLGWPLWLCMVVGVAVGTGGGWLYLNPIHRRITGLSFEMVSFLSIVAISNLDRFQLRAAVDGRRHRSVSHRRLLQHDGIRRGACGDPLRRRVLLHPLPEVGLREDRRLRQGECSPSSSRPAPTLIATRADCFCSAVWWGASVESCTFTTRVPRSSRTRSRSPS